jgi:hypothetical protein
MKNIKLPNLPYIEWSDTRMTIHLLFQIIGKARLKLTPRKNHWWYVTLYVTPKGFSTHSIPVEDGFESLEIEIDIKRRAVVIIHSARDEIVIPLEKGLSVASFYEMFMEILSNIGLNPKFINTTGIISTLLLPGFQVKNWLR